VFVLEVTVDGLGAANDLAVGVVLGEVLSQETGVGVRVITTNHDETVELEVGHVLEGASELLGGLDLVASGSYSHKVNNLIYLSSKVKDRTASVVRIGGALKLPMRLEEPISQPLWLALLFLLLQLFTLTDHIEATRVTVEHHVFGSDLHVVVREDTVGAGEEAEQLRLGVQFSNHVKETHDNIVSTSSLASGEDATNLKFQRYFFVRQSMR